MYVGSTIILYEPFQERNMFFIFADTASTEVVIKSEKEAPECAVPAEFTIGDVVWAQARGLPSWPGKIVDERDVGSGKPDTGKVNIIMK